MRAVILLCLIHLVFARRVPQSPLLPLQDERNVDTIPAADLLAGLQHQLADLYHALDNEIDYLPRLLTVFQYWMPLTVVGCESVPCENLTDPAGATKKKEKKEKPSAATPAPASKLPCPPDSKLLGRHTAMLPTFMTSFAKLYPCSYCANHLQQELKKTPPKVSSSKEFSQWMCEVHNEVNERLGKPQFDCSKVSERWRDGCSE
ncbi:ERV/ALR sulfhydryl oxidase domain-containing protein [Obelidium mucronatum]|nr:ERV/ALR sulfhydryl oxidase domain-containing protein [Obelidium mucronatum]